MKKLIALVLALVCVLGLVGCNKKAIVSTSECEAVSTDYGKVIDLAKTEFAEIFKEFDNIQIDETSTLIRTEDAKQIVVQITYSSNNGSGVYGFEYNLDDYTNPELIRHGEDITIDILLE